MAEKLNRVFRATDCFVFCLLASAIPAFAAGPPVAIEAVRTNGQVQTHLSWPAMDQRSYSITTSTNLGYGGWWPVANNPITPTNLMGDFRDLSTNSAQFYKVSALDTRGPDIIYRYPATNGISVGRFATLTLNLTDESGVDTNRFVLTCNGLTLTNGCPGVTVTTNSFQYVPGTNAWGDYGATSTVSMVCADLRGNTTTSAWSFSPEVLVTGTSAKAAFGTGRGDYALPFSYTSEFTVGEFEVGDQVRITPGIVSIDLKGKAEVSCVLKDWRVVRLEASISSQLAAELRAKVELLAKTDATNKTTTLAAVPLAVVGGFIGPVPVWVELQLGVDLGAQVSAEGAVAFETGVDAYASSDFRLVWGPAGWDQSYNGSFNTVPMPLEMSFELSAEAFLYHPW